MAKVYGYCAGCGKKRPMAEGYLPTDPRYLLVQCGGLRGPGFVERKDAMRVIGARRAAKRARRAARAHARLQAAKARLG